MSVFLNKKPIQPSFEIDNLRNDLNLAVAKNTNLETQIKLLVLHSTLNFDSFSPTEALLILFPFSFFSPTQISQFVEISCKISDLLGVFERFYIALEQDLITLTEFKHNIDGAGVDDFVTKHPFIEKLKEINIEIELKFRNFLNRLVYHVLTHFNEVKKLKDISSYKKLTQTVLHVIENFSVPEHIKQLCLCPTDLSLLSPKQLSDFYSYHLLTIDIQNLIKTERFDSVFEYIQNGNDLNITTSNGKTLLNNIILIKDSKLSLELVKCMLENGVNLELSKDSVIEATKRNHYFVLTLLLESGANVNFQDNNGRTALMYASLFNYIECLNILLYNQANLEIQDNNTGRTALMYATENGNLDSVKLLLSNSADINRLNGYGLTLAVQNGHINCLEYILQQGANIHLEELIVKSALIVAAKCGQIDCLRLLIRYKADINYQDSRGWSALMHAAMENKQICLQELIANGAKVDLQSKNGYSALMFAAEYNYIPIIQSLLKNGASLTLTNNNGLNVQQLSNNLGHIFNWKSYLKTGDKT